MEDDILDTLEIIGYSGPLLDKDLLKTAVENGPKSVEYTKLVEWLSSELSALCKLDDRVNAITSCPHQSLTTASVSQRLMTAESRSLLLVYLMSELQAARMVAVDEPETDTSLKVKVHESSTANDLKTTLLALEFSKPPDDITAKQLFAKVEARVEERLAQLPPKLVSKPLFTGLLSEKQWQAAARLHAEMSAEYRLRREMLLTRLDVTIQSFQWSGKAKSKVKEIASAYGPSRREMPVEPNVTVADLLAAREDLTILEKTSSANVRKNTQCSVNKVLIGRVPDRGGRPREQRAPPPEMPSWKKRTEGPSSGRGGGRGGGNRVQGGWSGGHRGRGGGGGHYNR